MSESNVYRSTPFPNSLPTLFTELRNMVGNVDTDTMHCATQLLSFNCSHMSRKSSDFTP